MQIPPFESMYVLLEKMDFRCYVSLPEGTDFLEDFLCVLFAMLGQKGWGSMI